LPKDEKTKKNLKEKSKIRGSWSQMGEMNAKGAR
jgi:hypothetical protein